MRRLAGALALTAAALTLAACAGDGASDGDPLAGKKLFASEGCAGCHALKAAASTGTQGPDLDQLSPSPSRVLAQLNRPAGFMPSFATKLSATQKKDLAAFVGAGNASGKAVAAPFKVDGKKLGDCVPSDSECLEQSFGNLTFNDGPKPALAKLQQLTTTDAAVAADCHRIAHRMGSAALARYRDRVAPAFIAGSPVCASGYYHGIIERAFLGQPPDKIAVVARQLCSDSQIAAQPFLAFQCEHGLGHGLMLYTGYDLPGSLKVCDGLQNDFDQVSCSGGVFMENFVTSYGVKSKYVRANDPIYPCNITAEHYKHACYQLVTANILKAVNYDQAKTAKGCLKSEPEWVRTCFESFGRDMSGIAGRSASKALASCRLAGSHQTDCLYGVAGEIVNSDADPDRGVRLCKQAPADTRDHCFEAVGSVVASLKPSDDGKRAACAKAGTRYAGACLRGAGLQA